MSKRLTADVVGSRYEFEDYVYENLSDYSYYNGVAYKFVGGLFKLTEVEDVYETDVEAEARGLDADLDVSVKVYTYRDRYVTIEALRRGILEDNELMYCNKEYDELDTYIKNKLDELCD